MKHIAILSIFCALLLTGCAAEQTPNGSVTDSTNQSTTVGDIMEQATQQEKPPADETPELAPETIPAPLVEEPEKDIPEGFGSYESVDIDLTTMSSVMVYTQVYTMISKPEEYIGKTVKMHGDFGFYYEPSVDTYYFGIVVQDATACCSQGIEFTLADQAERIFPDDYPEPGEAATVVGVFNTYFPEESPEWEYYHLEQAEFITE